jgi:hypothetical protein
MTDAKEFTAADGKDFRILFEDRPHYLIANVRGREDSLEVSVAYWQQVLAECRRRRADRVLVVDEIDGEPMGPAFLAQLVARMAGSGLESIRVAFVELVSAHVPLMEHGQILAMEQGFQARVFSRMDDADRWLRFGAT